jgi:hypothetical protein
MQCTHHPDGAGPISAFCQTDSGKGSACHAPITAIKVGSLHQYGSGGSGA